MSSNSPCYSTYCKIKNDVHNQREVIRVWDRSSISPLTWTGDDSTSGFTCANEYLATLSPTVYLRTIRNTAEKDWASGPHMLETITRHVMNHAPNVPSSTYSPTQAESRYITGNPEERSSWISTTRSIDWAIYECAKRLSMNADQNYRVHLTTIRHSPYLWSYHGRYSQSSLWTIPYLPLGNGKKGNIRADLDQAIKRSTTSRELLYYGRIYGQAIRENYEWSRQSIPFPLPSRFWKYRSKARGESRGYWLGELAWNPRIDDWATALKAMTCRRFMSTWSDQPVHKLPSRWPPVKQVATAGAGLKFTGNESKSSSREEGVPAELLIDVSLL